MIAMVLSGHRWRIPDRETENKVPDDHNAGAGGGWLSGAVQWQWGSSPIVVACPSKNPESSSQPPLNKDHNKKQVQLEAYVRWTGDSEGLARNLWDHGFGLL